MVLPRTSPRGNISNIRKEDETVKTCLKVIVPLILLGLVAKLLLVPSSPNISSDPFAHLTKLSKQQDMLDSMMRKEMSTPRASVGQGESFAVVPPHGLRTTDDNIGNSAASQSKTNRNPVIVVNEDDIAQDFTDQIEFEVDYFHSKPDCNPLLPDEVSFTLTTQLSLDRLWIMKHQCERWPSPLPISIAVYIPADSDQDATDISKLLDHELHCDVSDRMTVTVLQGSRDSFMSQYPINILRNLAMDAVQTSHVVDVNSDVVVSEGLYFDLLAMAPIVANDTKAAIILPAFEYFTECEEPFSSQNNAVVACLETEWVKSVPKTRSDLINLLGRGWSARPKIEEGFCGAHHHNSTIYKEWRTQERPLPITCLENNEYEPYLAVRLCNKLPEYPRVFRGYGWNKIIMIHWLLQKLGYRLWQIPNGFVLHLPHEDSHSRKDANDRNRNPAGVVNAPEVQRYLAWFKEVPDHADRLPQCEQDKTGASRRYRPPIIYLLAIQHSRVFRYSIHSITLVPVSETTKNNQLTIQERQDIGANGSAIMMNQ